MTIDELLAEMREKRPPVPERELHELEAKVGHRLPEDYRRFLLACNGGFLQGRFAFGQLSSISSVYGLRDDISLMRMWEVMRGRLPEELMPIMDDPCNNEIVIGVRSKYFGKIYFWNHKDEWVLLDDWDRRVETAEHISLIAESFTDFVGLLKVSPHSPI